MECDGRNDLKQLLCTLHIHKESRESVWFKIQRIWCFLRDWMTLSSEHIVPRQGLLFLFCAHFRFSLPLLRSQMGLRWPRLAGTHQPSCCAELGEEVLAVREGIEAFRREQRLQDAPVTRYHSGDPANGFFRGASGRRCCRC